MILEHNNNNNNNNNNNKINNNNNNRYEDLPEDCEQREARSSD